AAALAASDQATATDGAKSPADTAAARLHALFEADWERQLQDNPLLASYLGDRRHNARLPDLSPAAFERQAAALRASLATLETIDRAALSPADQLNHDLYQRELRTAIDALAFPAHRLAVDQRGGVHLLAVQMAPALRFESARDYADWIARLRAYDAYVDQTIALLREGMASGWVAPKAVMQRVPAQIAAQRVAAPEDSSFYKPFLAMAEAVPAEDRERLQAEGRAAVAEVVLP